MNATKILFIVGILALLVLSACSSNADKSYAPSGQQYVGGGCGVNAPVESSDSSDNSAANIASAVNNAVSA